MDKSELWRTFYSKMPDMSEIEKTKLTDWFCINNDEHLAALRTVLKTGRWPRYFIPADVSESPDDVLECCRKAAEAYLSFKLDTKYRGSS